MPTKRVPFFRPAVQQQDIDEVIKTLRSGWLTTGPHVSRFEKRFASAVGASNAIAVNSGTAALHLAVEAFGLKPGQGVLVPTMTFAATAEVVRYQGATPILVDCDPVTLNMDLEDAARRLRKPKRPIVGIMPVHVGGVMMNLDDVERFASEHGLWIVEDAAHAFPAGWRTSDKKPWQFRSNGSKSISCYSFYANKTITTGEGGMAVTNNSKLARRMKLMSLHGLSEDAWNRYSSNSNWDYKIIAPGFKYNLTDIAAAIGVHQLSRAETMRRERARVAERYLRELAEVKQIDLPLPGENRIHSWHLFAIRLKLKQLKIDRDEFIQELKRGGVGCSVHWRPLHLHPYYHKSFGYRPKDFPVATAEWKRLVSLPIFPGMRGEEIVHVIDTVKRICVRNAR
jgi:perosamine synthetase